MITAEPNQPFVEVTREFAAPPDLIFRCYTEPTLVAQWLGPRRLIMTIDVFEVRDGGRWRYTHHGEDGVMHGFHGVFHGQPSIQGITQTFEYEEIPGHVVLEKVTFTEQNGKTLVTQRSVFQYQEDRDGMLASGMEEGVNDSGERLDELLDRLQAVR